MLGSTHVNYLKVLEWIIVIVLCFVSVYFSRVVLHKFISERTSMAQSKEHIKELPMITFCFYKPDLPISLYEYSLDFKIEHLLKMADEKSSTFLVEGNTALLGGTVRLNKIISAFMGNCFKISYKFKNPYDYQFSYFRVFFNQSIPWSDIPTLNTFITSEKNSYGIVFNDWKNGKAAKVEVDKIYIKIVDLSPEKFIYMNTKDSKCSYEPFYECFSRLIKWSNESSVSLPFLPICKGSNFDFNFWHKFRKNGHCPKLCYTLQYYLETSRTFLNSKLEKNVTFAFGISLDSKKITV